MIVEGMSGAKYQLAATSMTEGAEGDIYSVIYTNPKLVAKVYKAGVSTRALEEKLTIMLKNPPSSKVLSQVAWPLDIIYDSSHRFCGFIMHELNADAELIDAYTYPSQVGLSTLQKIIIAENICAVISEVHKAGYFFGDFNPRNIKVDIRSCEVAFLDTDSYQVSDYSKNRVYRCNVCAQGYAAPELLKKCADHILAHPNDSKDAYAKTPLPTFTQETDNFALAIHIFKLLMNGYSPFGGVMNTDVASLPAPGSADDAVRRDLYCYKPGMKHPAPAIPPLEVFPQEIADLFTRAFIIGKTYPEQRPTAIEWHCALVRFEKALVTCTKNPLHQYDRKNTRCPLCEADQRFENAMTPSLTQKRYSGDNRPPVYVPPATTVVSPPPPQPTPVQIPPSGNTTQRNLSADQLERIVKVVANIFGITLVVFVICFFQYCNNTNEVQGTATETIGNIALGALVVEIVVLVVAKIAAFLKR